MVLETEQVSAVVYETLNRILVLGFYCKLPRIYSTSLNIDLEKSL